VDIDGSYHYSTVVAVIPSYNFPEVEVCPNPTSGVFNLTGPILQNSAVIEVMDLSGKVLEENAVTGPRVQLNLAHLPKGIYFLRFAKGGQSVKVAIE
jgi:hypothetical protein